MPTRSIVFVALGLIVATAAFVIFVAVVPERETPPPPAPREPILPDLITTPMSDFLVGTDEEGNEALRFTATVANIGVGPLLLRAARSGGSSDDWRVAQWFQEPDGSQTGRYIDATLIFGGHGHEHWHLKYGTAYRLFDDGGSDLRSQTKAGYCWFDQIVYKPDLPGAPEEWVHSNESCGKIDSTRVSMGMSIGWSDPYFWQLEDQFVDITGLPDGDYRLEAYADPDEWLQETDETNNLTWTRLRIGTQADGLRTVEVLESSPAL